MEPVNKDCVDCGNLFTISVGEQQWLAKKLNADGSKGWSLYKRCLSCRAKKRQACVQEGGNYEPQLPARPPKRV